MAGTAHLVAALKYIELGNYTANQLLIPFMIAHSNILNEIFRGKFSHNRDHCSPPPAAGLCERDWQLRAALALDLMWGQDGTGAPDFLGSEGRGQCGQCSKTPWPGWKRPPSALCQGWGCGDAKGESRQLLPWQVAEFADSFYGSVFWREPGTQ